MLDHQTKKEKSKARTSSVLFSTYSMAAEGLDIPTLDSLVLATSIRDITQPIGRVLRKSSNSAIIVDIADDFSIFISHLTLRKRSYKKFGYTVKETYFADGEYVAKRHITASKARDNVIPSSQYMFS